MHPIIYRSRPTHSGIACAAVFAAITSCAPGVPHMSTVQATERPYLAVNELEMRTTPEAKLVGSFVERNKCIQFIPYGETAGSLPIFPRGTTLTDLFGDRFQLEIGTARISQGVQYEVTGGFVNLKDHRGIRLSAPIAAGCPDSTMIVGAVSDVPRRR